MMGTTLFTAVGAWLGLAAASLFLAGAALHEVAMIAVQTFAFRFGLSLVVTWVAIALGWATTAAILLITLAKACSTGRSLPLQN